MRRTLVILGPTATGKSQLALRLAAELGGEIINADALQVYRGFDIGTAKPTTSDRDRVRHHLIDILEPETKFSAGEFARLARASIQEISARGLVPVIVGGSGLYLRALMEGISPLPPSDPDVRRQLEERADRDGLAALYEDLGELDPASASRLNANDKQRILRALEVFLLTERPLSSWIAEKPYGVERLPAVRIGLTLPRAVLYDRIARRIDAMVEAGWLTEVRSLLRSGADPTWPAFQALGYRQLAEHLKGSSTLEEALRDTLQATRNFSKRQQTWFRKESDITWFDASGSDKAYQQVLAFAQSQTEEANDV